jgi:hypothetical protein
VCRNHFHPARGLHSEAAELERGDNNQRADREHGVETTVPKSVDRHAQQKACIKSEELREWLVREKQHNPIGLSQPGIPQRTVLVSVTPGLSSLLELL